jgi:hypothetical protein
MSAVFGLLVVVGVETSVKYNYRICAGKVDTEATCY